MTLKAHNSMMIDGPTIAEPNIYTPLTATTVALSPAAMLCSDVINPAGTIAALTLTLTNGTIAGQRQRVLFTQIVTALTCSGANLSATVLALPTAAAANQAIEFIWSGVTSWWIRVA